MGNIDLIEDACARLPHTTRKMFGGHGLFAPNGGMFAGIVTDDEIVLKLADEAARSELVALGGRPWVYKSGSSEMTMKEWIVVPDRFYDEPQTLAQWAKRAHQLVPGKVVKAAKGAKEAKGAKAVAPKAATPPARAPAPAPQKKAPVKKAAPAKQSAPKKAPKKAAKKAGKKARR